MTTSTPPEAALAPAPSTLPNALTVARIVAAPVVAGLLFWASATIYASGRDLPATLYAVALTLFVLAALTDWLDGALARRLNAATPLGAALDHAADKALVTACLVALAATSLPFDLVIAAAIILVRDVAVAGLREGLSLAGRALPVSPLGKIKTVMEMIGVGAAIAVQLAAFVVADQGRAIEPLNVLGFIARATLWAAAALALWSAAEYARAATRPQPPLNPPPG
ncbi:MAG: CDP-diacylglycerol--glycerol-3-phosphate 3-phosphatidyltransferase [Hyphomonadaceae bacterium]|nr:CDP-diacylglycerol--glycerol-3-phosphate 3-phosphatidyltransferase [Hyphomonadaceae bacterium]